MGAHKPWVRLVDGQRMIEPVLRALGDVCPSVVVVGDSSDHDLSMWRGVRRLPDLTPGQGPLSGLEALMASGMADGYLVAACDQPGLTAELLERLVGGSRGRFFRGPGPAWHPLPGYYPASWLEDVRAALGAGRRSLRALIDAQEVSWAPLATREASLLRSLDTPDDVLAF